MKYKKVPDPKKSGWPDKLDQGADWLGEDAWSYYITPYLRITEKEKMYFENFWIENVLVVRLFQDKCLFYKNVYECKLLQLVTYETDPFFHLSIKPK